MNADTVEDISLFGAYCVFGALVFVGGKLGLQYFPPVAFAALRLDVAGIILLMVISWWNTYWYPQTMRDLIGVVLTGIFTLGLTNTLLFIGQQYVTSAIGAIAYSFMPILTTVFAVTFLPEESLDTVSAIGILLGLIGVSIVASPNPENLLTSRVLGVGVMVASVAIFASGSVMTQRLDPPIPRVALTAWGCLVAGLWNHGVSVPLGVPVIPTNWTLQAVYAVLIVGVLATALLYAIHFELLERIGPSKTSLTFYLQPVVAAILSWLFFGRRLSAVTFAGFLIIALGFSLIERHLIFRLRRSDFLRNHLGK
jgi:probable blue pigment (indigoidine) exporter